jgi:acyl carrier protein
MAQDSRPTSEPAIFARLQELISHRFGVKAEEIRRDSSFIDDLGGDSIDIVELIIDIEKAFDLSIPDEDSEKIATVQDAIDYIRDHVGG